MRERGTRQDKPMADSKVGQADRAVVDAQQAGATANASMADASVCSVIRSRRSSRRPATMWPIEVRVGSFLTVDRVGPSPAVIFQAELLRHKTILIRRGEILDEVKLVRGVAIPVHRGDTHLANLPDGIRLDVGRGEIAEEEIDGSPTMRGSHRLKQIFTELWAALYDQRLMFRNVRI